MEISSLRILFYGKGLTLRSSNMKHDAVADILKQRIHRHKRSICHVLSIADVYE